MTSIEQKKILVCGAYAGSLLNFRGPLLSSLVAGGHVVYGAAPDIDESIADSLRALNVQPVEIALNRTGINVLKDIRLIFSLMAAIRTCKPDIVLFYTAKPVIYGGIAARLTGVKNIFSMITGLGYGFSGVTFKSKVIGLFQRSLYKIALGFSKVVIFQNPDDERLFRGLGLVRRRAITRVVNGSGVDTSHYSFSTLQTGPIVFLTIARLLRAKGIREYCEAARVIQGRYPEVEFRIVGWFDKGNPDGFTEKEFDKMVDESRVKFIGRLKDVRPQLEECSVFVLPSYREGTPRSVLEALSIGRSVITTDAPGCRETVVDGVNGFLVPSRNVEKLINAMERLICSPELLQRFSFASRQLAEEKYSIAKVNDDILNCMCLR